MRNQRSPEEAAAGGASASRAEPGRISGARFALALGVVLLVAGLLRGLFPVADPPIAPTPGVVWHDEGAWAHNARTRVLFGAWSLDRWNPMYIAPVFTGLEYVSFRMFGVGLWQARLVSEVLGWVSVLLVGLGVARLAGRLAGLIAAAVLATNFAYVMYDRGATMEASMVSLMVVAWYGYVRAQEAPRWGALAGIAAVAAFFTKASAAFMLAALCVDALLTLAMKGRIEVLTRRESARAAAWTLGGLAVAAVLSLVLFVLPHWPEYRFYNWQMSVTRKPVYSIRALADRLSWLPVINDFFSRMLIATLLAVPAALGTLARLRSVHPGERLLAWWLGLGALELVVHDVGNERYFIFLAPALVALAAIALGRDRRLLPPEAQDWTPARALIAAPAVALAFYIAAGSIARLAFLPDIRGGHLSAAVRLSAFLAALASAFTYASWPRVPRALAKWRWGAGASIALAALIVAGDLLLFGQWAGGRTYKNYQAMRSIALWLPPGTLVHGKLANGLALESRIRPVFVGRRFGNYEDRKTRDDIRFLLTYVEPWIGYEGDVIRDVLRAYPAWRIVQAFDVAESPGGSDRAALVDKMPPGLGAAAPDASPGVHESAVGHGAAR